MKPAPFDYFAPTSVKETCALFARYGENAKILAGGQSLYLCLPYAWRNQKY